MRELTKEETLCWTNIKYECLQPRRCPECGAELDVVALNFDLEMKAFAIKEKS